MTLFAEIHSSAFQDISVTTKDGRLRTPINELYYYKRGNDERDLIILYGNTQALTTFGQYELCGRILDVAEELGCHYIVTLGGLRREKEVKYPKLYFAASDREAALEAEKLGAEVLGGNIFGLAGLLIALGKLRGFSGFCLLAETTGFYPDETAAREALNALCKFLNLKIDLSRLGESVETTRNVLESFGIIEPSEEKIQEKRRESRYQWFI